MTLYIFETMTASDAANFTSNDNLAFLSTSVSSINVVDNAATALTQESLTLSAGTQSLIFNAGQLSTASLASKVSFNSGDVLLLGQSSTASSTSANDTLDLGTHGGTAGHGAEAWGFNGADLITGSNANDTILGGEGDDTINGVSSAGATETDYLFGGNGADNITGGAGNDHIYGNSITSAAGAADGNDIIDAGAGNDYVNGNAGNDSISGGDGNDRLYGGNGIDTILGGNGIDYLQGNKGNDSLDGGNGNDVLHGGADNDTLLGNTGDDQLFGDNGNDSIVGGAGFDVLTGGAGNDIFSFGTAGDASNANVASATTAAGHGVVDQITDFQDGADKINLTFVPAAAVNVQHAGSASSGVTFSDAAAAQTYAQSLLTGHASDVAAITVGADTYLFFDDTHSTGMINAAIKVVGVADSVFTNADFV